MFYLVKYFFNTLEILKIDSDTFGELLLQLYVCPGWHPPNPRELEPELQRGVRHLRPRRPQGQPRQVPAHRQHRPAHGQVGAATRSISSERVSWQRNFSSVSTTLY